MEILALRELLEALVVVARFQGVLEPLATPVVVGGFQAMLGIEGGQLVVELDELEAIVDHQFGVGLVLGALVRLELVEVQLLEAVGELEPQATQFLVLMEVGRLLAMMGTLEVR